MLQFYLLIIKFHMVTYTNLKLFKMLQFYMLTSKFCVLTNTYLKLLKLNFYALSIKFNILTYTCQTLDILTSFVDFFRETYFLL